jgi:dynein light chain LC8-type
MEKEDSKESMTGQQLKPYKGAKVLWPLECSFDILDNVIEKAMELVSEYDIDQDGLLMATKLKQFMEELYKKHWHVVIGRHFGCYSIHDQGCFIYFYIETVAFMIYKAG